MGLFEAVQAMGDAADIATANLRAAQELKHNPKEYQWVEERVTEALLAELSQRLNAQLAEGRDEYVQLLEAQKQAVADPARRAELERKIAEMRGRAETAGRAARRGAPPQRRAGREVPRPHPRRADARGALRHRPRRGAAGRAAHDRRAAGAVTAAPPEGDPGERWARRLVCSRTGAAAPLDEPAFLSPAGAPWLVEYDLDAGARRGAPPRPAGPPVDPLALPRAAAARATSPAASTSARGGRRSSRCAAGRRTGSRVWLKEEARQPDRLLQGARPLARRQPRPRAGRAGRAARQRRQRRPRPRRLRRRRRPAGAGGAARRTRRRPSSRAAAPTAPRCSTAPGTLVEAAKLLAAATTGTGRSRPCASPTASRGRRRWASSSPSSSAGSCRTGSSTRPAAAPASSACTRPSTSCERLGLVGRTPAALRRRPGGRLRADRARLRRRRGDGGALGGSAHARLGPAGAAGDRRLPGAARAARDRRAGARGRRGAAAGGDGAGGARRGLRVGPGRGGGARRARGPGGGGGAARRGSGWWSSRPGDPGNYAADGAAPADRWQRRLAGVPRRSRRRRRADRRGRPGRQRRRRSAWTGVAGEARPGAAGDAGHPLRLRLADQAVHRHPGPGPRRERQLPLGTTRRRGSGPRRTRAGPPARSRTCCATASGVRRLGAALPPLPDAGEEVPLLLGRTSCWARGAGTYSDLGYHPLGARGRAPARAAARCRCSRERVLARSGIAASRPSPGDRPDVAVSAWTRPRRCELAAEQGLAIPTSCRRRPPASPGRQRPLPLAPASALGPRRPLRPARAISGAGRGMAGARARC